MARSSHQNLFARLSRLRRYRQRRRDRKVADIGRIEPLETRLALAADIFTQQQFGSIDGGWQVIVLDANADDLYFRHTLTSVGQFLGNQPQTFDALEYDTDVNFNAPEFANYSPSAFRDVLITNGIRNSAQGNAANFFGGTNGAALLDLETAGEAGITPLGTLSSVNAVVPGTLSGRITIPDVRNIDTIFFTTQTLQDTNTAGRDVLVFSVGNPFGNYSPSVTFTHSTFDPANPGTIVDNTVTLTTPAWGGYSYVTGDLEFDFNMANGVGWATANNSISVDYASPIVPTSPSTVQLSPGFDFGLWLLVDLPAEDSTVRIASPIVSPAATTNLVVLSATNVEVDAPVTSDVGFYVMGTTGGLRPASVVTPQVQDGIAGDWYGGGGIDTEVERLILSAPVTAPEVGVILVDDLDGTANSRGRFYVSSSGSLTATGDMSVDTVASDIIYEGDVSAARQSYRWQTRDDAVPYQFVTTSAIGSSLGSLSATTIDVFLSNTQGVSTANSVQHLVDLDTAVGSLRLSATQGISQPANSAPFNYAVTIREQDALTLDASLASGGPVSIAAGGAMAVNATVRSAGDVRLSSTGAMTGNAWLTTTEGVIGVTGLSVALNGLMQVLAAPFDETLTDIEVVSTNGGISLGGGARAVNRIALQQSGTGGVTSAGVVGAEYLDIVAEDDVNLQTDGRYIDIKSDGQVTLVEENDAEFNIDAAGLASLTALGVDPSDGRSALSARLRGSTNVVVSAPSGSIDVTAQTANDLAVGDAAGLLNGTAVSMRAAGDVSIRSTQGNIFVLDAPVAGDGVLRARMASRENGANGLGNFVGSYAQNVPGVTPATLTGGGNWNINNDPSLGGAFGTLTGPLRVRDIVLLRGQDDQRENGLYQITRLGSSSSSWQLTRVAGADTTAEFGPNTRVAVTDGEFAGRSFKAGQYANLLNTTPLRVTEGMTRSQDEVTVRLATEIALNGVFAAGQITAAANGGMVVNGLPVNPGDVLLVRNGVAASSGQSSVANGIYRVVSAGSAATPWALERFVDPDTGLEVSEATVIVSEGFYRTSLAGTTFSVAYDGLGLANLSITEQAVTTQIGSYDPSDVTTFVVSTNGGVNDAAGSLGKMLRLVQDNSAQDLSQEDVDQAVQFANVLGSVTGATGTIVLRQELPLIEKAFEIDTAQRYPLSTTTAAPIVIDGSRITSYRENTFVTRSSTAPVNGFEFASGSSTELLPTPEEASRGRISGLQIGGFESGGAVVVDGASNLLIENLTIGLDENNESQAVKYGIHVTGNSGDAGPVTLLNNSVFSASVVSGNALGGAGILIDGAAQHVQVVGGSIGGAAGSNTSGIIIESTNDDTNRANSIGVNPITTARLTTRANRAVLTFADPTAGATPDTTWLRVQEDLHLGQAVSGNGIAAGTEIIHIDPASRSITLSTRMTASVTNSVITFGTPNRTVVADNFYGVEMRAGNVRMVNTTVERNVLDGVVIGTALPDAVWARIGDSTTRSAASNAIHSNGRYGIRFASGISSMTESWSLQPPAPVKTNIRIQGNYIGTNTNSADGLQNGRSDYYWDQVDPATGQPYGYAPPPGGGFESLINSADPDGTNPAEDVNGNVSADLAPPSGGGTVSPPDGGVVRLPPRL